MGQELMSTLKIVPAFESSVSSCSPLAEQTDTVWSLAPSRHYFSQTILRNAILNVNLSLIGWFESASANGHRAYIEVRELTKPLNHSTSPIWHWNISDVSDNVLSIMKVMEYWHSTQPSSVVLRHSTRPSSVVLRESPEAFGSFRQSSWLLGQGLWYFVNLRRPFRSFRQS
jgi:hypothetical protein